MSGNKLTVLCQYHIVSNCFPRENTTFIWIFLFSFSQFYFVVNTVLMYNLLTCAHVGIGTDIAVVYISVVCAGGRVKGEETDHRGIIFIPVSDKRTKIHPLFSGERKTESASGYCGLYTLTSHQTFLYTYSDILSCILTCTVFQLDSILTCYHLLSCILTSISFQLIIMASGIPQYQASYPAAHTYYPRDSGSTCIVPHLSLSCLWLFLGWHRLLLPCSCRLPLVTALLPSQGATHLSRDRNVARQRNERKL